MSIFYRCFLRSACVVRYPIGHRKRRFTSTPVREVERPLYPVETAPRSKAYPVRSRNS
jgi:hypothetical protein